MLGEMLIELKQAQHALVELEAVMKKEPNRFRTYYHAARAASLTGDKAKASQYYKLLVDMPGRGRDAPRLRRSARSPRADVRRLLAALAGAAFLWTLAVWLAGGVDLRRQACG